MNSCCMAKMVTLRKMMREGSKPKFYDNDREVAVFRRIAREMIEDLEKRLEAYTVAADFKRGSKSGMSEL